MNGVSKMYDQMSLLDMPSATFLPELEFGALPCEKQAGRMTDPCGQDHALASLSARQAKALARKMIGIYGQFGLNSSVRASLTSFSVSRFPRHWF